jgi:hypothetical protein
MVILGMSGGWLYEIAFKPLFLVHVSQDMQYIQDMNGFYLDIRHPSL